MCGKRCQRSEEPSELLLQEAPVGIAVAEADPRGSIENEVGVGIGFILPDDIFIPRQPFEFGHDTARA